MEKVIVTVFKVESEAYQALSKMKSHTAYQESLKFSQVALLKKSNGQIQWKDGFDTGIITGDDTWKGGLLGGLIGILGGPLGMLLGLGVGSIAGAVKDTYDARDQIGIVKYVSSQLDDDNVAIIAIVKEEIEEIYNRMISDFESFTKRHNIEDVKEDIKHAEEVEKKLKKQADEEMK